MDVIFQDDEGVVESLIGAKIAAARAIIDTKRHNVLLMWFEDGVRACWYRVYLDDFLCGVDRYAADESAEDEDADDDFAAIDHNRWFAGKRVIHAIVESNEEGGNSYVSLTLEFDDKSSVLFHRTKTEGHGRLRFVE